MAWSLPGLGEIGRPEEQDLIESYAAVVDRREPVFGSLAWGLVTGFIGRCEFARFPLSEDGVVVSQIVAMEDYDFPKLDALPSVGPTGR